MPTSSHEHGRLQAVLQVLRRRIRLILLFALLLPLAALAFSLYQEKQYTSVATLLFRDPGLDQTLFGATFLQPNPDPQREAETNLRLVQLSAVAAETARSLGNDMTEADVTSRVRVVAAGQSDLVNVEATDGNPRFAALLANTFAKNYIGFRRDADRAKVAQAQRLIESQLDEARAQGRDPEVTVRQRDEQLKLLAALQTGNAELVQTAKVPDQPSAPRPVRNTAVGLILGMILGLIAAFTIDRLDRRLRDFREIEPIFGRPVLGAIPEARSFSRQRSEPGRLAPLGRDAEPFLMLRANLVYFNVDREQRSIMVTSAMPGEGKSTVAWNLALAMAHAGDRVLLLEADLRKPNMQQRHGLRLVGGLSAVLAGTLSVDEATQTITTEEPGRASVSLDVMIAGPLPPNPSDLMNSQRMAQLLRTMALRYDRIIIDTPPLTIVSDAVPLARSVDAVIAVTRLRLTTHGAAELLSDQLSNLRAPLLGVVVNSADSEPGGYGGGYGYGGDYDAKHEHRSEEPVPITSPAAV